MIPFYKYMALLALIYAQPSLGQDKPKCMVRVSTCNGSPQCPIQDADFFIQAVGYLDKEEYAPGRYNVFYPCSNVLSRIYIIATECPVAYTTVAQLGTTQGKLTLNCSVECQANPSTPNVSVSITSTCGGDLRALGVSPQSDIKDIAYLNHGSVTLTPRQLPLTVNFHHPTHATKTVQLTTLPTLVQLECRVNGGWGLWVEGPCSRPCDTGIRNRTRPCDQPAAANGGQPCVGEPFISELCNTQPCPGDGGWSEWFYTPCTLSCGGGTRNQIRECNNPPVTNGGLDCPGDAILVLNENCNEQACPIDGGPGFWTDWCPCSCNAPAGIGPAQTRRRPCNNPTPAFGGTPCSADSVLQYMTCNPGTQCFFCTTGCCTGSSYQLLTNGVDHVYNKRLECERLGGKLLELNCLEEKILIDQLIDALAAQDSIWLGMIRLDNQIVYMTTNEPVTYLEWAPNEPSFNGDCFELINPTFGVRDAVCNQIEQQHQLAPYDDPEFKKYCACAKQKPRSGYRHKSNKSPDKLMTEKSHPYVHEDLDDD